MCLGHSILQHQMLQSDPFWKHELVIYFAFKIIICNANVNVVPVLRSVYFYCEKLTIFDNLDFFILFRMYQQPIKTFFIIKCNLTPFSLSQHGGDIQRADTYSQLNSSSVQAKRTSRNLYYIMSRNRGNGGTFLIRVFPDLILLPRIV